MVNGGAANVFNDVEAALRIGLNAFKAALADDASERFDFGRDIQRGLPDTAPKRAFRGE